MIVRQRCTYSPRQVLLWHIVEPLNFVMEPLPACYRASAKQIAVMNRVRLPDPVLALVG